MEWLALIAQLILGFMVGTLVLWICSFTVNTETTTIKAAAVYNGIMAVLVGVLLALGLIFLRTESDYAGVVLFLFSICTLIASFWLLMRIYTLSFWASIWLFTVMWAVETLVEKLIDWVT